MEKYGFRGPIYNLMVNYMSDRWQYVIHDEIKSTRQLIVTSHKDEFWGPFCFFYIQTTNHQPVKLVRYFFLRMIPQYGIEMETRKTISIE